MDKPYPPQNYDNSGYPPQNQGYPPQGQGYPPQGQGYPPQGQVYPPQGQGYPPQEQGYPPQGQGYPPQQNYSQPAYAQATHVQPHSNQDNYYPPNYNQESSSVPVDTNEKFKSKTKFNDLWAAALFFVQLIAFVVLSYFMLKNVNIKEILKSNNNKNININKNSNNNINNNLASENNNVISRRAANQDFSFQPDIAFTSIATAGIISGILSLLYVILMQVAAKLLIIVSFWFSVALYALGAAYYLYAKVYFAGIILAIFAVLYAFLWFSWRSRIPFAELMLINVSKFTRRYPGTIVVGFFAMLISLGYVIYWAFTLAGIIQYYDNQSSGSMYALYVFSIFSLFWTTQLIKDICHFTVSGAFASDYFFPSTTSAASKFTSFSSLGRALTTSFGSACFGSLLVAILQVLKTLAREARHNSDNFVLAFLACCAECILAQIEELVRYFNRYAYCYCAMYGLPYVQAGKATWNLIKDRGVEAIINDSLVGNVLTMGSVLISVLGAVGAYVTARIMDSNFDNNVPMLVLIIIIGFIVSILVNSVISSVIESANTAFFVCLAEDPQALSSYNPELFEKIRQTYPEVVQPV